MSIEQDRERDQVFFVNFSRTLGGLAIMMVLFLVGALYIARKNAPAHEPLARLEERTAPVGQLRVEEEKTSAAVVSEEGEAAAAPVEVAEVSAMSGADVYGKVCIACHGGAIPGIPAIGDVADWAPRIQQGREVLYSHAIDGYEDGASGLPMPPRGGNDALSDEEVKVAVDYMLSKVGG